MWTLKDGTRKASLVLAKAKLSPLTHKGEVSRSELSAAVIAAKLKLFIQQESGIVFGDHLPFLDSQIAQYMMRKDSYIYNTFMGLRVSELQK